LKPGVNVTFDEKLTPEGLPQERPAAVNISIIPKPGNFRDQIIVKEGGV
jgi:hypothetical protein